jgi:hypothetical protein
LTDILTGENNSINEKEIILRINNKLLDVFRDKSKELKTIFNDSDCLISGSFIIESILNEQYENSDIINL